MDRDDFAGESGRAVTTVSLSLRGSKDGDECAICSAGGGIVNASESNNLRFHSMQQSAVRA